MNIKKLVCKKRVEFGIFVYYSKNEILYLNTNGHIEYLESGSFKDNGSCPSRILPNGSKYYGRGYA